MVFMLGLLLAPFLGLITAAIASRKGHSGFGFWLFGTLLFIVALPVAILLPPDRRELDARELRAGARRCPHCAEIIRSEAKVCRYCGRDVAAEPALPASAPASAQAPAAGAAEPDTPPLFAQPREAEGVRNNIGAYVAGTVALVVVLIIAVAAVENSSPPTAKPADGEPWDTLSSSAQASLHEVCETALHRANRSGAAIDTVLDGRLHIEAQSPARYRCGLSDAAGTRLGYLVVSSPDCRRRSTCAVPVSFVHDGVSQLIVPRHVE